MCLPSIILLRADGPTIRVMRKWIRGAEVFTPNDVIGGVDGAVIVVVSVHSRRRDAKLKPVQPRAARASGRRPLYLE